MMCWARPVKRSDVGQLGGSSHCTCGWCMGAAKSRSGSGIHTVAIYLSAKEVLLESSMVWYYIYPLILQRQ